MLRVGEFGVDHADDVHKGPHCIVVELLVESDNRLNSARLERCELDAELLKIDVWRIEEDVKDLSFENQQKLVSVYCRAHHALRNHRRRLDTLVRRLEDAILLLELVHHHSPC